VIHLIVISAEQLASQLVYKTGIVLGLTQKIQRTAAKVCGAVMANLAKRVSQNALGDFFMDSTCIDCDACRQIAPAVFSQATETSYVSHQPETPADRRAARHALLFV